MKLEKVITNCMLQDENNMFSLPDNAFNCWFMNLRLAFLPFLSLERIPIVNIYLEYIM